jgi:hypothetical protein
MKDTKKMVFGALVVVGGAMVANELMKRKNNTALMENFDSTGGEVGLSQVPPYDSTRLVNDFQVKGGSFASPYYYDDYQGQISNQFDGKYPGFVGSELDFVPQYQECDEKNVAEFQAWYGEPQANHLANVHQPVDTFLGSYRGYEFYQPGCYPTSDTRVYTQSQNVPYVPGPMSEGIDSATMLKPGVYPELTHSDGFQDILIDAPRNLFWADNVFDQQQSLTRNYNQNYDLRGDEPLKLQEIPCGWGISQSTQGPYEAKYAVREFVY